ncbi:MAG: CRTAC1 family protein [Planctomycetaceae bacterium]|nr:CRTAC1 family protein [Planctomycetaceae bacterium]
MSRSYALTKSKGQDRFDAKSRGGELSGSGHERIVRILDKIQGERRYERLYFGESDVEQEELSLPSIPVNMDQFVRGRIAVADRRLWRGQTKQCLEHLQTAWKWSNEDGAELDPQLRQKLSFKLGLAYLRLAENENCVHCNNGESCLLPISSSGIHERREGSEQAIGYLLKSLELNPENHTARWLLNVANMTLGRYPDGVPQKFRVAPQHLESERDFPRFPNIAIDVGLNTTSLAGGIVVDDFDGDDDLDVITSSWGAGDQLKFFRNIDGHFADESEEANFTGIYGGLNLLQADYDNDGDLDLLVLRGAWFGDAGEIPNSLLENDGAGRFRDVTIERGLAEPAYPTQTATWFDFDNDGDLDLYVGNENFPSQLFENNGAQGFRDIASQAGVANGAFTKGVVSGDYNGDRYPDLYVSNFGAPNQLFRNNQDGTFTDVAADLGVTAPIDSFPVWFWDYNQDGHLDIFAAGYTLDMQCLAYEYFDVPSPEPFSALFEGTGGGEFREVAEQRHVRSRLPPMGANFGDLDNDGYPDFSLGTGAPQYEALMPNLMFWNGQGERFWDVTTAGGFGHLQKGHGIAFADFDNDGDQDLLTVMGGAFPGDAAVNCVFQNPGMGNHWLTVRLVGQQSNRSAIGARICVEVIESGQTRRIYHWVSSGGSFGANPLRCEMGLGKADRIVGLTIDWPTSGISQTLKNVQMDQFIEIQENRTN